MSGTMSGLGFYERGLLLKKVQIFDMALTEFQQATTDPQQAGKAFAQVGLCLKALGREDDAVRAFRQALETGAFSTLERVHIQYLLAQTLESLDQEFEALVVYRRIRREHPNFQDVDARIQDLSSGRLRSRRRLWTSHQREDVFKLWEHLKPQVASLLSQTWQRLARYGDMLETPRPVMHMSSSVRVRDHLETPAKHCSSSSPIDRSERRRQGRIAVQMFSQFSSKTPIVAGEGEIRDLSASGCRIMVPCESLWERRSSVGSIRKMAIRLPWRKPPFGGMVIGSSASSLTRCDQACSARSQTCAEHWLRCER